MVVAQKPKTRFSAAEYLALEEEAEYRSEYYQGEIFAMSGGSANHNRIAGNLFVALRSALRGKPCEAFINDMRLQVKRHHLYTYPDVMVVCGKIEFAQGRNDTIANPILIVEVLSPSTEAYDRGKKFEFYRSIEGFQEYVLVDQQRMHIERYRPLGLGRWEMTTLDATDEDLSLTSVGIDLTLASIYERVDLESELT